MVTIRRTYCNLSTSLFLLLSLFSDAGTFPGPPPEIIKNLNDPEVIEMAEFTVSEYNKETGCHLKFIKF